MIDLQLHESMTEDEIKSVFHLSPEKSKQNTLKHNRSKIKKQNE